MKLLYSEKQIQNTIKSLAKQIRQDMDPTTPKIFVGLLNGAFMFYKDIVKEINHPVECDFMRVKSYSGKKQGDIQITKDLETPVKGKDIYIVDDIFDSGNTMNVVTSYLELKQPNSINIVTLLTRDFSPIPKYPSYHGFVIKDEWVCGYGMDDSKGYMRNNPNVYEI